jgi:hypothetical protein
LASSPLIAIGVTRASRLNGAHLVRCRGSRSPSRRTGDESVAPSTPEPSRACPRVGDPLAEGRARTLLQRHPVRHDVELEHRRRAVGADIADDVAARDASRAVTRAPSPVRRDEDGAGRTGVPVDDLVVKLPARVAAADCEPPTVPSAGVHPALRNPPPARPATTQRSCGSGRYSTVTLLARLRG